MQVLGKTIEINKDNPNWVNEISDLISDSRQREAVTDLSVIAQALVSEVAMQQARADGQIKVIIS